MFQTQSDQFLMPGGEVVLKGQRKSALQRKHMLLDPYGNEIDKSVSLLQKLCNYQ